MSSRMKRRISGICLVIAAFICMAGVANAQKIVVDAAPSHAVNSFSPFRALGAAIDRLPTGTPEKLLTDPVLKEILGAGWQTVTYRQNTELMVEAWHWNACVAECPVGAIRTTRATEEELAVEIQAALG